MWSREAERLDAPVSFSPGGVYAGRGRSGGLLPRRGLLNPPRGGEAVGKPSAWSSLSSHVSLYKPHWLCLQFWVTVSPVLLVAERRMRQNTRQHTCRPSRKKHGCSERPRSLLSRVCGFCLLNLSQDWVNHVEMKKNNLRYWMGVCFEVVCCIFLLQISCVV